MIRYNSDFARESRDACKRKGVVMVFLSIRTKIGASISIGKKR